MQTLSETARTLVEAVPANVVSGQAARRGERLGEPLLFGLDGMLRYAEAYRARFDDPLANDYVLGPHWLAVVKGLRGLMDGAGAVAMQYGWGRDSKDNGVCESLFWQAMQASGFTEADL